METLRQLVQDVVAEMRHSGTTGRTQMRNWASRLESALSAPDGTKMDGARTVAHCPHATSSPLRYCDPCPVTPCPMELTQWVEHQKFCLTEQLKTTTDKADRRSIRFNIAVCEHYLAASPSPVSVGQPASTKDAGGEVTDAMVSRAYAILKAGPPEGQCALYNIGINPYQVRAALEAALSARPTTPGKAERMPIDGNYPEDAIADPDRGNYTFECCRCKGHFRGFKRRNICKACDAARPTTGQVAGEAVLKTEPTFVTDPNGDRHPVMPKHNAADWIAARHQPVAQKRDPVLQCVIEEMLVLANARVIKVEPELVREWAIRISARLRESAPYPKEPVASTTSEILTGAKLVIEPVAAADAAAIRDSFVSKGGRWYPLPTDAAAEGMVMVPREPTYDMLRAVEHDCEIECKFDGDKSRPPCTNEAPPDHDEARKIWKAMLAASPHVADGEGKGAQAKPCAPDDA